VLPCPLKLSKIFSVMNNTNTFKVSFCVIGNKDCCQSVAFSGSIKKALKQAASKAWDLFNTSSNTNWADCWVTIYNPKGKQIWSGFEGDLKTA